LLVLYHRANAGGAMTLADPETALLREIRQLYKGQVMRRKILTSFDGLHRETCPLGTFWKCRP
jgi:hypothetical protein